VVGLDTHSFIAALGGYRRLQRLFLRSVLNRLDRTATRTFMVAHGSYCRLQRLFLGRLQSGELKPDKEEDLHGLQRRRQSEP
jgi:hypothetical protein